MKKISFVRLLNSVTTTTVILCFFGCAGRQIKAVEDTVCPIGIDRLKKKLGPEFGKVVRKLSINKAKKPAHGCALIYRRVAEESPEELPPGEVGEFLVDDRLALVTVYQDAPRFRKVAGSPHAPGPVQIKMRALDVNGDQISDFVIEESAPLTGSTIGYKGLRIFDGHPNRGQEILSLNLKMKTTEGLELIPRWRAVTNQKGSFIVLSGGGEKQAYRYDPQRGRFVQVKVAPPKPPASAAPAGPKAAGTPSAPAPKVAPKKTPKPEPKKPAKKDDVLPFL